MSGEELAGQRRELFGAEDVARCDICGTRTPVDQMRTIEMATALGEHERVPLICPNCRAAISRGEIDAESFLLEEDERRDRDEDLT